MKLANYDDVPWRFIDNPRQGRIEFKEMLAGEDGSMQNYGLVIGRIEPDFASPRHRHNFDQVRLALEGPTNIGPRWNIEPGDLAYFPEGCHYGPQNQGETGQMALSMVVQFGGASGMGYMSMAQMSRGARELALTGRFDNGVYRYDDPAQTPRNRDGYEAIWRHVQGQSLTYPSPRFDTPVMVHPAAYAWRARPGSPGVRERLLAMFTERRITLSMVSLEAGCAWQAAASNVPVLWFALSGEGAFDSHGNWSQWSAAEVAPGEAPTLHALTPSVWFRLALPAQAD